MALLKNNLQHKEGRAREGNLPAEVSVTFGLWLPGLTPHGLGQARDKSLVQGENARS